MYNGEASLEEVLTRGWLSPSFFLETIVRVWVMFDIYKVILYKFKGMFETPNTSNG